MHRLRSLITTPDRFPWLWLLLSAIFTLLATGRWTVALLAWLPAVFSLRFLRGRPTRSGFLLLFLTGWAVISIAWYGLLAAPAPVFIVTMAINAFIGALPFLIDRLLTPRLARAGRTPFYATLIFPLAATAIEFLSLSANPMGSFGAQAYSQYGLLPLMQLVSLTGLWGLTFLISWFASVVNWAWEQGFAWQPIRRGVLVYALLLLAVLGYGSVRLLAAPQPDQRTPVAAFTAVELRFAELMPLLDSDPAAFRATTTANHQRYLDQTRAQAQAGARIILWPEGAGVGLAEDVEALTAAAQELARQEGIYLAAPLFKLFPGGGRTPENRLLLIDPSGAIVLDHVKYGGNMFEGSLKGDGVLQMVDTPYGRLAGVICWDADFPANVRQVGQAGAGLLLIPANDWREIDPLHGQMAVFRAIENGVSILRQADKGLSLAADPYGRVLAASSHFADSDWLLTATVAGQSAPTLYARIGDAFAWLCVFGFAALGLWAVIAGRRDRR